MNKAEQLSFLPVHCYPAPSITTPVFIPPALHSHSWAYTKGAPEPTFQYTAGCQKIILQEVCPDFRAFSAVATPRERLWKHTATRAVHLNCLHPQVGRTPFLWILNLQPCTQGIYTINPFKSCLHLIHNLFCYERDFHKVRGVRWDLVLYSAWIHRL